MAKRKMDLLTEALENQGGASKTFELGMKPEVEIPHDRTPPVPPLPPLETPAEQPAQPETTLAADVAELMAKKHRRPEKASFTVYLSKENMRKLKEAAKKAGMSRSEFLDHLMGEIL